jgi:hypothetical protein
MAGTNYYSRTYHKDGWSQTQHANGNKTWSYKDSKGNITTHNSDGSKTYRHYEGNGWTKSPNGYSKNYGGGYSKGPHGTWSKKR